MTLQLLYIKVELFSEQLLFYVILVNLEGLFSILFLMNQNIHKPRPNHTIDLYELIPSLTTIYRVFLYISTMLQQ